MFRANGNSPQCGRIGAGVGSLTMTATPLPTTAAANALTARWARTITGDDCVLAGVGVWPLLGLLSIGAGDVVRGELEAALGMPAEEAAAGAADLIDLLRDATATHAALGLWTRRDLALQPDWLSQLRPDTHDTIAGDPSDKAKLTAWARRHTDGLIEQFPAETTADTRLLLATALSVRTSWLARFTDTPVTPTHGPWSQRRLAGLTRSSGDLDDVAVIDSSAGPITMARVEGDDDVDVHLVLGNEDQPAGTVLAAGIESLDSTAPRTLGSQLIDAPTGPGVRLVPRAAPFPQLRLATIRFSVTAKHDLLEHPDVFGLRTAADANDHRFPGISDEPLCVQSAAQQAMAEFTAVGFVAAAVTSIAMTRTSVIRTPAPQLAVTFDRPFGFVAVHRGVVLAAGWIASPEPWRDR